MGELPGWIKDASTVFFSDGVEDDVKELKERTVFKVSKELKVLIDRSSMVVRPRQTTTNIVVDALTKGMGDLEIRLKGLGILRTMWAKLTSKYYSKILKAVSDEMTHVSDPLKSIFSGDVVVNYRIPERVSKAYSDLEEISGIPRSSLIRLKIATYLSNRFGFREIDDILDILYIRIEIIYMMFLDLLCYALASVLPYYHGTVYYLLKSDLKKLEEYDEDVYKKLVSVLNG